MYLIAWEIHMEHSYLQGTSRPTQPFSESGWNLLYSRCNQCHMILVNEQQPMEEFEFSEGPELDNSHRW